MSNPTNTAAWLLVRRAPMLTDAEIITATGVHRESLARMRRRHGEMIAASITPTGSWARDGASLVIGEGDPTDASNPDAPTT
ncbi:hypothetical protein KY389_04700 [Paracoccus bogoriensis]|uniref:hypothetical protein n=1 Tax=Paracoccus bogoriensis TaxID=242065 RepID=UPI001CA4F9B8|nr:hypothetical protein [Paracoccus bogoriensis]MBW7055995.1 hypothetical protein [Paracoccus bogoriensis]